MNKNFPCSEELELTYLGTRVHELTIKQIILLTLNGTKKGKGEKRNFLITLCAESLKMHKCQAKWLLLCKTK